MKPIKINLNKWVKVNDGDNIDGYQTMYITPQKLDNGTQLPDIVFRKDELIIPLLEDCSDVTWEKSIHISNRGTEEEYSKRVDWWFDSAIQDPEYRNNINESFNKNGFDVRMSWEKAKQWLKYCTPSKRKTNIHKFIWNWLNIGMNWQLNRLEKERKK